MARSSNVTHALLIAPFLFIAFTCQQAFQRNSAVIGPWIEDVVARGEVSWPNSAFKLFETFWHIKPLDDIWRVVVAAFTPSTFKIDPVSWWQMFGFLADAGLVYAIWVIESNRMANKRTTAYYPTIIATIFQLIGGGIIAPFYYIAFLFTAPRGYSLGQFTRTLDFANMRTLLFSLLLTYYAPFLGAYLAPTLYMRHWCTWAWQMFPIWIAISQFALTRLFPANPGRNTANNIASEMYHVRLTVRILSGLSSAIWLTTLFSSPHSFISIFIPTNFVAEEPLHAIRTLLQWDHLCFLTASLLWVAHLAADLEGSVGRGSRFVWSATTMVALGVVLGPGATVAVEWLKREESLVRIQGRRERENSEHGE